jgi:endonuclease III
MKDSSQYSKKIQKLYRSLKRNLTKQEKVQYDEPVEALVYAVLSENLTESQAQSSLKKLTDYFVDFNDLRVATVDEIADVLGPDITSGKNIAVNLLTVLRSVYEKYNMLTLQALKKTGKRPAKQLLEKFAGTTAFVVDYVMLTALQGHAIPLNSAMTDYLKKNELVHAEAGYEEIAGFLTRQISAKNACEFYLLLRKQSESPKSRRKTKGKSKKKK